MRWSFKIWEGGLKRRARCASGGVLFTTTCENVGHISAERDVPDVSARTIARPPSTLPVADSRGPSAYPQVRAHELQRCVFAGQSTFFSLLFGTTVAGR